MSYDSRPGTIGHTCAEPLPQTLPEAHRRIRYLERTLDESTKHRQQLIGVWGAAEKYLWLESRLGNGVSPRQLEEQRVRLREKMDLANPARVIFGAHRVEGPDGE